MELMIFLFALATLAGLASIRDAIKDLKKEEATRFAVSLVYVKSKRDNSGIDIDTSIRSMLVITDTEEDAYKTAIEKANEENLGELKAKTIIKIN